MIGIYLIINTIDYKVYVGQSNNLNKRLINHKSSLKNNKHHNEHLQSAYNKYGIINFSFEILEECTLENIDERERFWIAEFNCMDREFGYNRESGGNELKTHSEETRRKMSTSHKGKCVSQETRKKIGEFNKGKTHSQETRNKLSQACKGKTYSQETRNKISESKKGQVPTNKIEITEEMIIDVENGITQKCFKEKYNSFGPWIRIRKGKK